LSPDGSARDLFAAAARGRGPATEVLAVRQGVVPGASTAAAGGVHGFPAPLTSFIGRAGAVHEVMGLLEQYRLVTVTGPGGAGKTRLAGEVASWFADGVWLAELATVQDPAQVPVVVAAELGVRDLPGAVAPDALARALARRQLLLVLDNCEHVIGAAASLCTALLRTADDIRVLATSREPPRVAGEARSRLGPLSLPNLDPAAEVERGGG
jgi:predicted ATPase